MDDELLTTAEAARIAGVGPTSVKRWADLSLLACVKTAGGHRRYPRRELERFLREHGGAMQAGTAPESTWVELLLRGGAFDLQAALFTARGRLGAWHRVAEEIGRALMAIGDAWQQGSISVLDEHVASEKLARALARVVEATPTPPDPPLALLATAQGDDHTLGLSLAELCLCEAGWQCMWSGRRTPTPDLAAEIDGGNVRMLAMSASVFSTDVASLAREARDLGRACRASGTLLVLGGSGGWPDSPANGTRVRSLSRLYEIALQAASA